MKITTKKLLKPLSKFLLLEESVSVYIFLAIRSAVSIQYMLDIMELVGLSTIFMTMINC